MLRMTGKCSCCACDVISVSAPCKYSPLWKASVYFSVIHLYVEHRRSQPLNLSCQESGVRILLRKPREPGWCVKKRSRRSRDVVESLCRFGLRMLCKMLYADDVNVSINAFTFPPFSSAQNRRSHLKFLHFLSS